jgi:hypothetical protein
MNAETMSSARVRRRLIRTPSAARERQRSSLAPGLCRASEQGVSKRALCWRRPPATRFTRFGGVLLRRLSPLRTPLCLLKASRTVNYYSRGRSVPSTQVLSEALYKVCGGPDG